MTEITKIPGIGAALAERMIAAGLSSAELVAKSRIEDLTQVQGISVTRATLFIAAAKKLVGSPPVPVKRAAKARKPAKDRRLLPKPAAKGAKPPAALARTTPVADSAPEASLPETPPDTPASAKPIKDLPHKDKGMPAVQENTATARAVTPDPAPETPPKAKARNDKDQKDKPRKDKTKKDKPKKEKSKKAAAVKTKGKGDVKAEKEPKTKPAKGKTKKVKAK